MEKTNENVTLEDLKVEMRMLIMILKELKPALDMVKEGFTELKGSFDSLYQLLIDMEKAGWPKEEHLN